MIPVHSFVCSMWLAPFTPGARHTVSIHFNERKAISLVRVFNYNASRTHAQRGGRRAELALEAPPSTGRMLIWGGEIACAVGSNEPTAENATELLFTKDTKV